MDICGMVTEDFDCDVNVAMAASMRSARRSPRCFSSLIAVLGAECLRGIEAWFSTEGTPTTTL
jgi:hypothetical protein